MPTSVRLDPRTEAIVRRLARRTGRTKSQVIREAILRLADQTPQLPPGGTLYDRVKHLIGLAKGGPPDLATKSEEYLREMFARRAAGR